MRPIRLLPAELPPVEDAATAAEFVRWLARVIGWGFHPDNAVCDYHWYEPIPGSGLSIDRGPMFHYVTARVIEQELDTAIRLMTADQYEVAMETLGMVPTPVEPGWAWKVVSIDEPLDEEGKENWPTAYATRAEAEEQLQNIMKDLAEDEQDRASLLRWFRVERVQVPCHAS